MRVDEVLHRAAELVLGAQCPGCGQPHLGACRSCVAAVTGVRPFLVAAMPNGLPPVASGGAYADELRQLVLAAKERGALGLLPLLGGRLAAAVAFLALERRLAGPLVLVPVPSAPALVAERGVDFTGALAGIAARRLRRTGLATDVRRGLALVRRPRDQSGLDRAERLSNLTGALRSSRLPAMGDFLVVDDIVTTGATMAEAVRACVAAGREPVGLATVAATIRRGGAR